MDEKKQPGISFDGIILKELSFSRDPGILPKPELDMKFNNHIAISLDKTKMNYEFCCEINEASKSFSIKCTMIGIFSLVPENGNATLEEFSKISAPALIFPYIREIIASTTLKAGIPSVLIPPVNIAAIMSEVKK
jgi:preprotein translocase subunit SecB